ncbi:alpha-L-arabinofuranosidase 1-like [Impatiens glandulifera]|uniref:alpha-L-arabinofuranosidase 1-like n=1 Tax=Impatiens glandulifera TaxID=253017 RepID=UPI001FB0ADDF|nr:alpha-L-arabinofuranosidase 1-like [Impatiens glandulifera]XP_047315399.1 alpha-L-arabinofuranosidase 1-like [Impatiens glandulifera]
MGSSVQVKLILFIVGLYCFHGYCYGVEVEVNQTSTLFVNASQASSRAMPETLFGIFFEEINHAGSGGTWAELVSNRGFEAGGQNTPFNIDPWSIIGDQSSLIVSTENSSCFEKNKIALRMDVQCGSEGSDDCPDGGVGIYNPGFWGMNIEKGKSYKVVLYIRSLQSVNVSVSLTDSSGLNELATANIITNDVCNWTKTEVILIPKETNHTSRLQLTTTNPGVIWFDQVSVMPMDTYKGHGFRSQLVEMLIDLKPKFFRFPGGCFVEGLVLRNAFRWKETIGPWEERPGHYGDVWKYWTDDGIGYFEFLQLAEDIGALPVWVFNSGISHQEQVPTANIHPFVQDALDGIEFARGESNSTWGSIRAKMGHPKPFDLKYVAIGNEDCKLKYYHENYLQFYDAIKLAYPDIQIISNCDGSPNEPLDHPADLYDFHIYTHASKLFDINWFDKTPRNGPKVFVSEYAVRGEDAGQGSLLAALGEAGFLVGIEKNSDIVSMVSYAPLFVNTNDRSWMPDAIVFNSFEQYGTPSYWMQHFFIESSGAALLNSTLQTNLKSLVTSAIAWNNDGSSFLRIKVVNIGSNPVNLTISIEGLEENSISLSSTGSIRTELTSGDRMDENSFLEPRKVIPVRSAIDEVDKNMVLTISPFSFTSLDLAIKKLEDQSN